jgi:hypothetical protein
MLNSAGSLHLGKSPVMGVPLDQPVKEPVYLRIQEKLLSHVPRITWDLGIQPRIEHLSGGSGDRSVNPDFNGLL